MTRGKLLGGAALAVACAQVGDRQRPAQEPAVVAVPTASAAEQEAVPEPARRAKPEPPQGMIRIPAGTIDFLVGANETPSS